MALTICEYLIRRLATSKEIQAETGMPQVLLGESGSGLCQDLLYFLNDLCPQGFLGRQIAENLSGQSGDFPPDHFQQTQNAME